MFQTSSYLLCKKPILIKVETTALLSNNQASITRDNVRNADDFISGARIDRLGGNPAFALIGNKQHYPLSNHS